VTNPYLITGPALISFSGGRTSAYMLRMILDAHGGTLPDDVHVCFANTGKELPETLRFVHECESRWGVKINWLEYRGGRDKVEAIDFETVGFNSASRGGEPFDRLLAVKTALPNWQARWCTSHLKVLVMFAFMRSIGFEPKSYDEYTGLRADEPWRVLKMRSRNVDDGHRCISPLASAGVTQADVLAFWLGPTRRLGSGMPQGFDLGLEPGQGNCDLCFMKGARLRASLIRANPDLARWWIEKETGDRFFDRRTRYRTLLWDVERQPELFVNDSDPDDEHDAECGLWCAGEAA